MDTIEHNITEVEKVPPSTGRGSKYDGVVDNFLETGFENVKLDFPEIDELETDEAKKDRIQAIRNAIKKRIDKREMDVKVSYQGLTVYLSRG